MAEEKNNQYFVEESTSMDGRSLIVKTDNPDPEFRIQKLLQAQAMDMALEFEYVGPPIEQSPVVAEQVPEEKAVNDTEELPFPEGETPVVEASETPLENDSPAVEETPAEANNDAPERPGGLTSSHDAPSEANTEQPEPIEEPAAEPIDDRLSRSKLLNRMYSPEEIDILRKAANNKPTATLGDDMKRAYAPKASQDAKMGVGDLILGAVWTVITLPIVIPWNILKVGAVTVGHFGNKLSGVRMAKAVVTEIPKHRRENPKPKKKKEPKHSNKAKQAEEQSGEKKPSLLEKIKGFFDKLFKKKEAPVVAEPEKEQVAVPNVQPIEDTTGKQSLSALIQDAQDTPDKAPAARAKEKEAERE